MAKRILRVAAYGQFILAASLAGPANAEAQQPQQAAVLSARIDSAIAEGTAESLNRALVMRRELERKYKAAGDHRQHGVQLNGIGNIYYMLGGNDSALVYYRRAAAVRGLARDSAGLGRTLGNIGNIYSIVGPMDSAVSSYRMSRTIARALGLPADESAAIGNLSALFLVTGALDSAMAYGFEAITLYRQVGDRQGEGQTLHNLAQILWARGSADSAQSLERNALAIAGEIGDRSLRAAVLQNVASIFNSLGEADSALAYGDQALAEYRTSGDVRGEAGALNNLGSYLSELGQFDSAIVAFRASVKLSRSSNDRTNEGRALMNIGSAWERLMRSDSALAYYSIALPIRREMEDKLGEGITLANMASILSDAGNTDSALVLARRSAALFSEAEFREGQAGIQAIIAEIWEDAKVPDSAISAFSRSLAISREIRNRREEAFTLASLARVHMQRSDADRAQSYFDSAAVARTLVSRRAGSDFNRISFADRDTDLFGNWTLLWLQRSDIDASTSGAASLAAYEKGRAQALLDLMGDSTGQAYTADLRAEGLNLARSASRPGEALISYGLIGDSVIIWSSRAGASVNVEVVPVQRSVLRKLVSDLRSALGAEPVSDRSDSLTRSGGIAQRGAITWNDGGRRLSDLVLPASVMAAIRGARTVTIIPAGELALVPFALLPVGKSRSFGDETSIRYAPSLASLRAIRSAPPRRRSAGSAIVIGDPVMPSIGSSSLPQLPAARKEAKEVGRILGSQEIIGDRATESAVRAQLSSASIVHLATHGLAYSARDQNRRSFVALASDSANDGFLTVGEILDDPSVSFRADLVVLSACETAVGALSEAEGTIGFQRALFAKGSRGVLLSLWKVSDEATSLLMQRFYTHWRSRPGKTPAVEALRRAQADVRGTRGFEHPRYWSAFQLAGDPD